MENKKYILIYTQDKKGEEKIVKKDIEYNPNYTFTKFLDENKSKYNNILSIFPFKNMISNEFKIFKTTDDKVLVRYYLKENKIHFLDTMLKKLPKIMIEILLKNKYIIQ